jgi:hypothetical protein
MTRKVVDVAVIVPDASPVLTLARIGRIDLLGSFTVPIKIVDQVFYEITKTQNDPKGEVGIALKKLHNQIDIVETNVGVGYGPEYDLPPSLDEWCFGERCSCGCWSWRVRCVCSG